MTTVINDGYVYYGPNTFDDTASTILSGGSGPRTAFAQFVLDVERAKLLASATLTINVETLASSTTFTITADDVDDSVWLASFGDAASFTNTSAQTNLTTAATGSVSFDVRSIVQEIINRSGWVSGNNITFKIVATLGGPLVTVTANTATLTFAFATPTATLTEDAYYGVNIDTSAKLYNETSTTLLAGDDDGAGPDPEIMYAPILRFITNIMPGAIVPTAYLQLYVASKTVGGTLVLKIQANDVDSAAWVSGATNSDKYTNIQSRALTTAFVNAAITDSDVGTVINIEVTDIIQEIVDRSGWNSNNYIMFIFYLRRLYDLITEFAADEHTTYPAPRLIFVDPTTSNSKTLAWTMIE